MSIQDNVRFNLVVSCFPSTINNPEKKLLFVIGIIVALGSVAAFITGVCLPVTGKALTLSLLVGGGMGFFMSGALIERLRSPTSPLCGGSVENSVPTYDPSAYAAPQPQDLSHTSYTPSTGGNTSTFQLRNLCRQCNRTQINLNNLREHSSLLDDWLGRLRGLEGIRGYSSSMALIIYDAIVTAEADAEYRDTFIGCLQDATSTCGDRMALSVLYIGLNVRINNAVNQGDLRQITALLLRGTMTLSILEEAARQKIADMDYDGEAIEVYLAYPVRLKIRLGIPIDIEEMRYSFSSGLNNSDLSLAAERVEQALANREHCAEFLAQNNSWQRALENNPRYQQLLAVREAAANAEDPDYNEIDNAFREQVEALTREFL